MTMTMTQRITAVILIAAALTSLAAWRLQTAAADSLAVAQELQSRDVASDSAPPSAQANRQIIRTLERAIQVRRSIEEVLVRIEDDVAFLDKQQSLAQTVTSQADNQLGLIGAAIGTAGKASKASAAKLRDLSRALTTSASLAEAIARELAELDRNLGPSVGGPR
jgi:hypothetical protein